MRTYLGGNVLAMNLGAIATIGAIDSYETDCENEASGLVTWCGAPLFVAAIAVS